jgi:hypothetical protein
MDSCGTGWEPSAGSHKHGKEASDFKKGGMFLTINFSRTELGGFIKVHVF